MERSPFSSQYLSEDLGETPYEQKTTAGREQVRGMWGKWVSQAQGVKSSSGESHRVARGRHR